MLDPRELVTVDPDPQARETLEELGVLDALGDPEAPAPTEAAEHGLVLVQALDGFVDAGGATAMVRRHLLEAFDPHPVARFDVDQLLDYRARRPLMQFTSDHWESYADPQLAISLLRDAAGTPFLLLSGPEPDYQWERFVAAVIDLARRLGVRLTIGLNAIPFGVPHTRPAGVTPHATRPELIAGYESWLDSVQVPSGAGHLLEYRLGQTGMAAVGFAAHVPHYVAQSEYPPAAMALLDALARVTGLLLPSDELREAAKATAAAVDAQIAETPEAAAAVAALEQQYDAWAQAHGRENLLAPGSASLPTGDQLAAQFERFLAEQARRPDQPE